MSAGLLTHYPAPLEGAFENSSQLRVFKTKLARTANVLQHLANPQEGLGQLLKPAEQILLQQSIELIESFSLRVDQAKERKIESEKALEQAFSIRQARSWELTKSFCPLKHDTLEQQANGLNIAMCLNQMGLIKAGKSSDRYRADLLKFAGGLSQNYGVEYFFHELLSDCQLAIQEHIASPSPQSVETLLDQLKRRVSQLAPGFNESTQLFLHQLSAFCNGGSDHGSPARN
jgi:hypothetical protein